MGAARPPNADQQEYETKTLGDVLYANRTAPRVSENEWVGLVHAIAAGDQVALQALYAQTYRVVFTLTMRIVGNRETAEEVTLDVFHEVWRRASTYDTAGGSVLGWILNQARSRAIDRLRHGQRKKRAGDDAHLSPGPEVSGPYETVESREQGSRLQQALQVLTPQEREAIETAFFSELTYREVAVRLNEPLGTVKTRIRCGLNKLRRALAGDRDRP